MGYRMKTKPASMRVAKEKPKTVERICGECRLGEWNADSFNYKGEPFMIYCEHSTYAYSKRRACGTCFGNTRACTKFEEGEKPNWREKGGAV